MPSLTYSQHNDKHSIKLGIHRRGEFRPLKSWEFDMIASFYPHFIPTKRSKGNGSKAKAKKLRSVMEQSDLIAKCNLIASLCGRIVILQERKRVLVTIYYQYQSIYSPQANEHRAKRVSLLPRYACNSSLAWLSELDSKPK